jgi:ATPase subunit of ABC transporter with duplicated ATPase domains
LTLAAYRGSLILVSHDAELVAQAAIDQELRLDKPLALIARGE